MEDMKEKELKVLTQEEFDEKLKSQRYVGFSTFKNYIVKDIVINVWHFVNGNVVFDDCRIESIVIDWPISFFTIKCVRFVNCEIVDYEKISGIDFCYFENCIFIKKFPLLCPEEGEFIGYKKCVYYKGNNPGCRLCVVKLLIPSDAKRLSTIKRECRCSKARVIGIFDLYGNELRYVFNAYSSYEIAHYLIPGVELNDLLNCITKYKYGEFVYPDSFDEDMFNECSHGIHFFMTFKEAKDF